jgi:glycosyltransferase involved in cell wall biosynthesis
MIENPDVCARIIISNYDALENPYYGGGGAVAVHEIAIRLTRDHDVLVLTGGYPGAREGLIDGVRYRRVGGRRLGPRLGQLAFHAALVRLAMVLEHDVWLESFTPPFSTSFLPLVNRKPVVGVVHFLAGSQMRNRYHLPFDRIERFGLRFYGDVIAVSQSVARQVAETNPRTRIRVIHNGVTVPEQRAPAQGRAFVGYLGRIDIHQKGLDLLIRAFAEAPDLSLPLVIAGSGRRRETKRLRALIAASGAGDRIRLLGRISGREKSEFLNGATMIVTPSRHESFSLTALEALAWGAPLVTFDIEGFSWIPRLAARKVPPYEVRALSEALTDLAGDSDAREELARAS